MAPPIVFECIRCQVEGKIEPIDGNLHRITCLGPCKIVLTVDLTRPSMLPDSNSPLFQQEFKQLFDSYISKDEMGIIPFSHNLTEGPQVVEWGFRFSLGS